MSPEAYKQMFGDGRRASIDPIIQNATPISAVTPGSEMFEVFTGMPPTGGLPVVNERTALTLSAVWACVSLIAGAISTLPMHVYQRKADGERKRLDSDDLWWILNEEFCPRWVASAGWEWMVLSRLFHGDAFAEIKRTGARITGIVPLHPLRTEPVIWPDGTRLAYVVSPEPGLANQSVRVLDQDDVLHVPGLGFDGRRSLSPLRHALRMSGAVALATQDYSGQFFGNMARPDYALSTEQGLDKEAIELLRTQLDEQHARRRGQAGRPMLLQGGLKVEAISLSNEDAELIASRQFQIEEIARVYGVPPFMIGHNEKTTSWGSGVAEMGTAFVRYVLRSHLNAFQNEINRKFFRTAAKCSEFDTFELERADMKSLFEAFRAALGRAGEPGFLTVNEVRKFLNFNKVDGGDDLAQGGSDAAQPAVQPATE